jgi:hypothetical protein
MGCLEELQTRMAVDSVDQKELMKETGINLAQMKAELTSLADLKALKMEPMKEKDSQMGCLEEPPKWMDVDSVDQKELMKQTVMKWAQMKADCLALPTALQMVGSWAQMKAESTSLADLKALKMGPMTRTDSQKGFPEGPMKQMVKNWARLLVGMRWKVMSWARLLVGMIHLAH